MASLAVAAVLYIVGRTSASTIPTSARTNGFCKQLDIPVFATAETGIYNYPRVDSDLEAISWAVEYDTYSSPKGPQLLLKNTTTSDTFNIHAQLCIPYSSKHGGGTLQIATHGVHYDSRYWDSELQRDDLSYVENSLKAGYSVLTYDRLGVGQSDILDAYEIVQAPLELEILRQLTLMARNGSLYEFAADAKPNNAAFKSLEKPNKIVHVGHSFGSFLTSAFIAKYGDLTDGAIITGFLLNKLLGARGNAVFGSKFANFPPYNRPSGYIVCSKSGIQNVFFSGDPKTAFTSEMLDYGDSIKQPVPIGEFASAYHIIGLVGPSFKGPVQYFLAEFDFYICGGDCKNLPEADPKALANFYPNATAIEVYIQPNSGHAFTLHNNATAGFEVMYDFLARHNLQS